ncbi:MAG: DUF438 domain-containing protein, partial [Bacteroidales bacterium]
MDKTEGSPEERKRLLKHIILQLHKGEAPQEVRKQLVKLLKQIPYNDVVEVEQQLIGEGLPEEEVLKFCDIHTQVLEGHIDQSGAKEIPRGHPVDTFKMENRELLKLIKSLDNTYSQAKELDESGIQEWIMKVRTIYNDLMDVEKHYLRKENLLFPYLEKHGITGPPKVMWGKHDEVRELLKAAYEGLSSNVRISVDELEVFIDMVLKPATTAVSDMIMKEEEILFPMCMDKLTDTEWYDLLQQSSEIGYCLFDPADEWIPEGIEKKETGSATENLIKLPSGNLTPHELINMLNSLPVEITFVDKDDKVKYYSQGKHQIFKRSRAIIGRDVRLCHPPKSVHIVEQILQDFKSGKEDSAPFWLEMNGRFIYIEYFAVRDDQK